MIKRHTKDEFIINAQKLHGKKFDYSKVEYLNNRTKVEIICPMHGSFFQTPNNHLRNRGCFKCSKIKKLLPNEFINRAKIVHNDKYDYSKTIYVNHKTKVIITCPLHGDFIQNTNHHLRGNGCSYCIPRVSKSEIEFLNYFNILQRQKWILNKQVDGYDLKTNTIYEFLGDYYHGNPYKYAPQKLNPTCYKTYGELYEHTIQRFNKLKSAGYNIKYIWESDWKKFKKNVTLTPNIISF
jgi:hypothetical protein